MKKSKDTTKKKIGIWIDHRSAILISLEGYLTTVVYIEPDAETHLRPLGGWKAAGTAVAQLISKEQKTDEHRKHQFYNFYQEIIKKLGNAENLFIFGIGDAKYELAKEIENIKGRGDRIGAIETSERLTENQMVEKVKFFFRVSDGSRGNGDKRQFAKKTFEEVTGEM